MARANEILAKRFDVNLDAGYGANQLAQARFGLAFPGANYTNPIEALQGGAQEFYSEANDYGDTNVTIGAGSGMLGDNRPRITVHMPIGTDYGNVDLLKFVAQNRAGEYLTRNNDAMEGTFDLLDAVLRDNNLGGYDVTFSLTPRDPQQAWLAEQRRRRSQLMD
jgi:hypothetical protein